MDGKEDDLAYIFRDVNSTGQPNYTTAWMNLQSTQKAIPDLRTINYNDNISAAWVHPRATLTLLKDINYNGNSTPGAPFENQGFFDNFGSAKMAGKDQQIYDLNYLSSRGMNDVASSLYINENMPADTWRLACCRHETGPYVSEQKCGKYWSQSPGNCGTMNCNGSTHTPDGHIVPMIIGDTVCNQWCRANPTLCDSVKTEWCRNNPGAPQCGCIMDTAAARAQRSKWPQLDMAPRQCWPTSECQRTDLVDTLVPTALSTSAVRCPDITAQIQEINDSIIIGSNLSQSQTIDKNTTNNTNANINTTPSFFATNWLLFLIIFIVIIFTTAFFYVDPLDLFV